MTEPRNSLGFGLAVETPYKPKGMPGVSHPNAKLSDEAVHAIRHSQEPQTVLAGRFKVHQSQISRVRSNQAYK